MHSEAVIPRMGRGRNTGDAMYCWVPVADAAVPAASGGGGGLVSSVDAPLSWLLKPQVEGSWGVAIQFP